MLLGIDLGTASAKALLLATDGTVIGEASSSYPVHDPTLDGLSLSQWIGGQLLPRLLGRQWEITLTGYRRSHFQGKCMVLS